MRNKQSVPSAIEAYRRRQARAEVLLLVFWIGLGALVVGAGYLVYHFLNRPSPEQVLELTGTPAATETASLGEALPEAPNPTDALAPERTATPEAVITLAPSATNTVVPLRTYTVQEGETFIGIASRFGVDLATMKALNPEVTPEFLNVGDSLTLPVETGSAEATPEPTQETGTTSVVEYQVQPGDTVAAIAGRYGSSVDAIVRENRLDSPDEIQQGQTLRIPVLYTPTPTQIP